MSALFVILDLPESNHLNVNVTRPPVMRIWIDFQNIDVLGYRGTLLPQFYVFGSALTIAFIIIIKSPRLTSLRISCILLYLTLFSYVTHSQSFLLYFATYHYLFLVSICFVCWWKVAPPNQLGTYGGQLHGLLTLKILGNSILSIYYRYLIQGIIHLESLRVKFCLFKKTGKWQVK